MTNTYIISLGGSLIATQQGIEVNFLKEFREVIINQVSKGDRFFIITIPKGLYIIYGRLPFINLLEVYQKRICTPVETFFH